MTAAEYQLKYPNMTKAEAERLAEIDKNYQEPNINLTNSTDWENMICSSCE